jgi:hypothetical protein
VPLLAFAASLEKQQVALSIVQFHRERAALLNHLREDGPLVFAVTATGDANQIETLLRDPHVSGIVPERGRLDWLSFALTRPFSLAFSRLNRKR